MSFQIFKKRCTGLRTMDPAQASLQARRRCDAVDAVIEAASLVGVSAAVVGAPQHTRMME